MGRALACNSCRKGKRKCNGEEPCRLCLRLNKFCTYSIDKRTRPDDSLTPKSSDDRCGGAEDTDSCFDGNVKVIRPDILRPIFAPQNGETKICTESVLNFYMGSVGQSAMISDNEAAKILHHLYGVPYQAPDMNVEVSPGSDESSKDYVILQGWKPDSKLALEKSACDKYIRSVAENHKVAHDAFVNTIFSRVYQKALQKNSGQQLTLGENLLLMAAFTLGTIEDVLTPLHELSTMGQYLFATTSSLIGLVVQDPSVESCMGMSLFGHVCLQTGNFLAQVRFNRLSLQIMMDMGYHRRQRYEKSTIRLNEILIYFWHVYTVCYAHLDLYPSLSPLVPLSQITAPEPAGCDSSMRDENLEYLISKIEIIRLHDAEIDHADFVEQVAQIQARVGKRLKRPAKVAQMYFNVVSTLILRICIAEFRKLPLEAQNSAIPWLQQQIEYFFSLATDYIHSLASTTSSTSCISYNSSLWHMGHQVFISAIVLAYCERKGYASYTDFRTAIGLLEQFEDSIAIVPRWLEILRNFEAKSVFLCPKLPTTPLDQTASIDRTTRGTEANIDADLSLDFMSFLNDLANDDVLSLFSEPFDWLKDDNFHSQNSSTASEI
ncbi:hypothetical protein V1511DRAFT_130998 [Dipodascopsis uninucleata]